MSILVQGYSGCGLAVRANDPTDPAEAGCHHVVEKSSPGPAYNGRLLKQIEKQESYAQMLLAAPGATHGPQIVIPRVLFRRQRPNAQGEAALVIGMTFEHHVDCISFINKASHRHLAVLTDALMRLLQSHVDMSPIAVVPAAVLSDKIADILRVSKSNRQLDGIMDELEPLLYDLREWVDEAGPAGHEIPVGLCHGDLTLSNILIQRGGKSSGPVGAITKAEPDATVMRVVLIDFLDSFVESPLADMAKLCQDLVYGWTMRFLPEDVHVDAARVYVIMAHMKHEMEAAFAGEQWYRDYFQVFFAINQLRVLRYSQTEADREYLYESAATEFNKWISQPGNDQFGTPVPL
jgi:thiamine kinase-like enzyme